MLKAPYIIWLPIWWEVMLISIRLLDFHTVYWALSWAIGLLSAFMQYINFGWTLNFHKVSFSTVSILHFSPYLNNLFRFIVDIGEYWIELRNRGLFLNLKHNFFFLMNEFWVIKIIWEELCWVRRNHGFMLYILEMTVFCNPWVTNDLLDCLESFFGIFL